MRGSEGTRSKGGLQLKRLWFPFFYTGLVSPNGRTETFSYFSYELQTGAVLTGEALVMNHGSVPLELFLYPADGFPPINGGTAFTKLGEESIGNSGGVSRWLSPSVTEIPLEPGEERIVPFSINLSPDISSGQYVVGLVVEALDIIKTNHMDPVLLDLMMPGINGFETLRLLQTKPQGRELPVIVITAREENGLEERVISAGGDGFL